MVAAVPLDETVEDLHITAARKLKELIQTVQDPQLLSRLIATALRFKVPKPKEAGADPAPSPAGEPTHRTAAVNAPSPAPLPRSTHQPLASSDTPEPAPPPDIAPAAPRAAASYTLPGFLPEDTMPYRQYELLHKQLGGEGARRRQREYREQHRAERLARTAAAEATPPDVTQSPSTPASSGSN